MKYYLLWYPERFVRSSFVCLAIFELSWAHASCHAYVEIYFTFSLPFLDDMFCLCDSDGLWISKLCCLCYTCLPNPDSVMIVLLRLNETNKLLTAT